MKLISDEDIVKGLEAIKLKKYRAKRKRKGSPKEAFLSKITSTIRDFVVEKFSISEIQNIIKENFAVDISKQTISNFIKKNKLRDIDYDENQKLHNKRFEEAKKILRFMEKFNIDLRIGLFGNEIHLKSFTHDLAIGTYPDGTTTILIKERKK